MKDAIIPYSLIDTFSQLDNIYEVRLLGWVIAKAQAVLKMRDDNLKDLNAQFALGVVRITFPARYLLDKGATNYSVIPKAFTLADKRIVYQKGADIYHLHIIAFPEFRKHNGRKLVTFLVHQEIWHAILDFCKGYRTFSLPVLMGLQSMYAVVFYLLVSNQRQPITYSLPRLRELSHTTYLPAYNKTSNLLHRVIDAARDELDRKAPYSFDYGCVKEGRVITGVTIVPRMNTPREGTDTDEERNKALEGQRVRLHENVCDYLTQAFGLDTREQEAVEGYLFPLGDWTEQVALLADIKRAADIRRVDNPKGYLYAALRNGRG